MATITLGIVMAVDKDSIDAIVQELEEYYQAKIRCVKQSWGKIWLKEGDSP